MQDIILISIPETTIKRIVEQAVKKALTEIPASVESSDSKVVDLNGLIKVRPIIGSKSTIYKKVYQGIIPHSKRGKKLYFDLAEIDQWLMEHKVKGINPNFGNRK